MNNAGFDDILPTGTLTIGNRVRGAGIVQVRLLQDSQIPDDIAVVVKADEALNLMGLNDEVGDMTLDGSQTFNLTSKPFVFGEHHKGGVGAGSRVTAYLGKNFAPSG